MPGHWESLGFHGGPLRHSVGDRAVLIGVRAGSFREGLYALSDWLSVLVPLFQGRQPRQFSPTGTDTHSLLSVPRLTGSEPLTILPLTLEAEAAAQAHYKACDRLKLERKQRRMCRRDPGVAETLVEAVSMSALECQYQFRFERWNCTLEGRYRASLLKRGKLSLAPLQPYPAVSPWHGCAGGSLPSALTESLGPRANPPPYPLFHWAQELMGVSS